MGRAALVISLVALAAALWSTVAVASRLSAPPPTPLPLSRAWGQGIVRVLTDLDRRVTVIEHTGEREAP